MNQVAALVAGLLLAASDHPLQWWPLQLAALLPFWWALWRQHAAGHAVWTIGFCLGFANTAAVLTFAGLAPPLLAAGGATIVQWTLGSVLAARMLTRGPVTGPLAAAALLTLIEIATWYAVPMFGTAQAFVRPLSAAPMLVAFVAFTGVGGLVFVVAALQALVVSALRGPARRRSLAAVAVLVAAVSVLDAIRWHRPLGPARRVGVFGWGTSLPRSPDGSSFVEIAAAMASGGQCRLLVTPETGKLVANRDAVLAFFTEIAALHPISMAVGVWHEPTQDNRIWFVDPKGALAAEYRKTHLVPWLEDYATGDGSLAVVPFGDIRLGGMICQDDNFTDIARAYGREGVPIVAVPTNDWPAIREFHLENAIFRSIENGYASVRAASGGISAIVSPRGEVLARYDHVAELPGGMGGEGKLGMARSTRLPTAMLLHTEVPVGDGVPTIYARLGDLPIGVVCAALVAIALWRRRTNPIDPGSRAEVRSNMPLPRQLSQ